MIAGSLVLAAIALLVLALRLARRREPSPGRQVTIQRRATPAPPKRQPPRRDIPHALYVCPHQFGGVVYVGISHEPEARHERRMAEFRRGNPRVAWVADSTGRMQIIRWYPDRSAALAAEDALIKRLALEGHPVANVQGNPLRRRTRRAA